MQTQRRSSTKRQDKISHIQSCGRSQLVELWLEYFRQPPPKGLSQTILRSVLAFELQARHNKSASREADLKFKNAQMRLGMATNNTPTNNRGKIMPNKLKAGSQILREWNGFTHKVGVIDDGFIWQDKTYKSLTAIAKAITGAHWSGPRFFGLNQRRSAK